MSIPPKIKSIVRMEKPFTNLLHRIKIRSIKAISSKSFKIVIIRKFSKSGRDCQEMANQTYARLEGWPSARPPLGGPER